MRRAVVAADDHRVWYGRLDLATGTWSTTELCRAAPKKVSKKTVAIRVPIDLADTIAGSIAVGAG